MSKFKLLRAEHVAGRLKRNIVDQNHFHLGETLRAIAENLRNASGYL